MAKFDQLGLITSSNGDITIYKVDKSKRLGDHGRENTIATISQQDAVALGLMLIRATRSTL